MGWPHWRARAVWRGVQLGLWQAQRLLLVGYVVLGWRRQLLDSGPEWGLGLGCVVCEREEPWVQVEKYVLVPKNDKPAGEMRRWTPAMRVCLPGRGRVDL